MQVQHSLADAADYGWDTAGWAGIYIDHLDGGKPVFNFRGDAELHRNEIARRLPAGTDFKLRSVSRSIKELLQLKQAIVAEQAALGAAGARVIQTGIRFSTNSVSIGLESPTAASVAILEERFGPGMSFHQAETAYADVSCASPLNCWPLKGGIWMEQTPGTGGDCTTGFMAKRPDNGQYRVLTAGHCIDAHGDFGATWKHQTNTIGTAGRETFAEGADADAGITTVSTIPANKNEFMPGPSESIRGLQSVTVYTNQFEGMDVCRNGITSNKDCGILVEWDVRRPSCIPGDCNNIDHTMEVSFDSTGGDSGGPVFYLFAGFGIHVHSEADAPGAHGWYSPLDWARSTYFNMHGTIINYCLSADCATSWPY